MKTKTYLIFTEDLNRDKVKDIVAEWFDGFTLLYGRGYWASKCIPHKVYQEDSLVIVINENIGEVAKLRVRLVAKGIQKLNNQESVMVSSFETEMEMI